MENEYAHINRLTELADREVTALQEVSAAEDRVSQAQAALVEAESAYQERLNELNRVHAEIYKRRLEYDEQRKPSLQEASSAALRLLELASAATGPSSAGSEPSSAGSELYSAAPGPSVSRNGHVDETEVANATHSPAAAQSSNPLVEPQPNRSKSLRNLSASLDPKRRKSLRNSSVPLELEENRGYKTWQFPRKATSIVLTPDGRWMEMRCFLCGGNTFRTTNTLAKGLPGFKQHLRITHGVVLTSNEEVLDKCAHKEYSDLDVQKIEAFDVDNHDEDPIDHLYFEGPTGGPSSQE